MAMVFNPQTGLFEDPEQKRRQMLVMQERAQEAQKPKKSFWTDQISTALGTLGAIGGTLVAPVAGTAAGGAAGAALGEFIENKLTGEDWKKNLLKEGVLGGVLSAGPIRLAKFARGANTALRAGASGATAMTAAKAAASTPAKQVFSKGWMPFIDDAGKATATVAPSLTKQAGRKIERLGGEMMNTQTNMTRAELRRIGGPDAPALFGHMNQKYGLNRLEDIAEVSRNVTGAQGATAEGVKNIIGSGKGIDVSDMRSTLDDLLTKHGTTLNQGTRDNFHKSLTQSIGGMYADQPLNPLANPLAAFEQAQLFRNEARLLTTGATVTGKNRQMSNIFNGLADAIEKKLYSQPGLEKVLPAVRSNMAQTYRQLAQSTGTATAQGKAYLKLADDVLKIKDIQGLRSFQQPWVQMSKIDEATALAAGNAAAHLGTPGGVRKITGAMVNAVTPTAGKFVNKAGAAMQGQGSKFNPFTAFGRGQGQAVPGKAGLLARNYVANALANQDPNSPTGDQLAMGDQLSPDELMALQSGAVSLDEFSDPSSPVGGNAVSNGFDPLSQFSTMTGDSGVFSDAAIQQMLENDIRTTGGQNINRIGEIVSIRDALTPKATEISANQQKGLMGADIADNIVNQIEGSLSTLGASGRVGGFAAKIFGRAGLNDEVSAYEAGRPSTALMLIKAIQGSAGNISDADRNAIQASIPSVTDTEGERKNKLARLRAIIGAYRQGSSANYGPVQFDPFSSMSEQSNFNPFEQYAY